MYYKPHNKDLDSYSLQCLLLGVFIDSDKAERFSIVLKKKNENWSTEKWKILILGKGNNAYV